MNIQVSKLESAREQVKGYESNLRRSHQTIEELREALTVKGREVAELTEATEQAYKQLEAVKTDQRQRIFDLESQLERSGTMPGESLGGVMEIQYKEQLASLEVSRFLLRWIIYRVLNLRFGINSVGIIDLIFFFRQSFYKLY